MDSEEIKTTIHGLQFLKEKLYNGIFSDRLDCINYAINALKEVQQYREIGTVEECRESREKQIPKKPKDELKINPAIDENGAYVDADMTVYLLCPNCGEMVGIDENVDKFCSVCGQAIDNENLDEVEDEGW